MKILSEDHHDTVVKIDDGIILHVEYMEDNAAEERFAVHVYAESFAVDWVPEITEPNLRQALSRIRDKTAADPTMRRSPQPLTPYDDEWY